MDETWRHGTLIGGMACRELRQVARAYKLAADELLKQALEKYEPHELEVLLDRERGGRLRIESTGARLVSLFVEHELLG